MHREGMEEQEEPPPFLGIWCRLVRLVVWVEMRRAALALVAEEVVHHQRKLALPRRSASCEEEMGAKELRAHRQLPELAGSAKVCSVAHRAL